MNNKNPFEDFINSLSSLNHLPEKRPEQKDIDKELVDILLRDWFRMFAPNIPIDSEKRDFVVDVFKEIKQTVIYEDWAHYILAMLDWFKASSVDYRSALLGAFLLGYCWNNLDYKDDEEKTS